MKTRSAKAKGKRLEKWVKDQIIKWFRALTHDDIRVTVGAETGADIKRSRTAIDIFPYSVECKNRETFGTIYKYFEQAAANKEINDWPVVIIKMNGKEPLAILNAEHFMRLASKNVN